MSGSILKHLCGTKQLSLTSIALELLLLRARLQGREDLLH
jgi:hypothetical protein